MKNFFNWPRFLQNSIFARLYFAQAINLIGDSLTWLGLALLSFELAGERSGSVLAGGLTLRVLSFVIFAPIAGVIADRVDRRWLMVGTHLARMIITCFLPFVVNIWQFYLVVLSLNIFSAFFTPTFTATIPLIISSEERSGAMSLSSATYQLLGVIGPGIAGGLAAWIGTKEIFFVDALTFLIAAIMIATLSEQLIAQPSSSHLKTFGSTLKDIHVGTLCLFKDQPIRYALSLQLIAAIAGAEIIVNSVSYVQGILHLGKLEYGYVMSAFGVGATITSISLINLNQHLRQTVFVGLGVVLITLSILPANWSNFNALMILWIVAGIGQTLVNLPTQTLIADRISSEIQGRVYGAHFAWSHLWWFISYPLAGWMSSHFVNSYFFYSSLAGIVLIFCVYLIFKPEKYLKLESGQWHEHPHNHLDGHDDSHQHYHSLGQLQVISHEHIHFHKTK